MRYINFATEATRFIYTPELFSSQVVSLQWKKKEVLVTGAGGFIGSHLVERLVALGANVSCFVRYNSMNRWGWIDSFPEETRNKLTIITGDLRDSYCVKNAVAGKAIVFHLGALIPIPYSYLNPRDVVDTNVIGTLNVLQACKEHKVERLVHTSTSETYGTARKIPISEEHPVQGQSPYAASKIAADKIAESFFLSYGLPVVTIRPFNTYGPRQSARAIIPTIITQALTGKEIKLGSLAPKRDFTFVTDIVDGFIRGAETTKAVGQAVNLGSNSEVSIGELASAIASIVGKKVTIVEDKQRIRPEKSEVARLRADSHKAEQLLGWKPNVPLSDGLQKTVSWMEKNIGQYKTDVYNI